MLLTLSVSSSDFISYFLHTTYFNCVLEAILVAVYIFSLTSKLSSNKRGCRKRIHKRGRKCKKLKPYLYNIYIYTLLILGKKRNESQKEVKPAGLATKKKITPLPVCSRSGSATEDCITFKYFPGFCFGKFLRNRW